QLQVEVETAANDVEMIVDQPGQDAPALEIDNLGLRTCQRYHLFVGTDREEAAVPDRDGRGGRPRPRERREKPTMQDQIGGRCWLGHVLFSCLESISSCVACS